MAVYIATGANTSTKSQIRSSISDWFHPRLRNNATLLMEHIKFHGWKIYVRCDEYSDLASDARLPDAYAASDAAAALHRLGCLAIRQIGDRDVLELLDGNIDRLANPVGSGAR